MPRLSHKPEILAAAVACFAEYGYAATRIRAIANRAGVSEAAFYRHFPSVEELAASVYLQNFSEYSARVVAAIGGPLEQGRENQCPSIAERQLRAVVGATLALYREGPDPFLFALEVLPAFLRRLPEGFAYPLEQVEMVIRAGQHAGTVRDGQPNVLAALFFGAVLRPIQLTTLAVAGAIEMRDGRFDQVIMDAAVAALIVTGPRPKWHSNERSIHDAQA